MEWVPKGETVIIQGVRIDGGMIYVGERNRAGDSDRPQNALINPSLSASGAARDPSGDSMPYWPSYSEIEPRARRTYLEWLANGRDDPEIGVGYVFLYFYGLEYRLFFEQAEAETNEILAEVKRLISIYGGNNSFRGYAERMLDAAGFLTTKLDQRPPVEPPSSSLFEMPYGVRAYLGRKILDGENLDADDALLWMASSPAVQFRTPAIRCFEELRALWNIRFSKRFPKGMNVKPPKRKLSLEYRAASGRFDASISGKGDDLPDIGALTAPVNKLYGLLAECTSELDAYSRLLGRSPEAKGSIDAAALLPADLMDAPTANPLKEIATVIAACLSEMKSGWMPVKSLLEAINLDIPTTGKIPATTLNKLGAVLDKLGLGFEPDRRLGSMPPGPDDIIVLFEAKGGVIDADSDPYRAAKTITEICALAAGADGEIAPEEIEHIKLEILSVPGLSVDERQRLFAYAKALCRNAPRHQTILRKLSKADENTRKTIARSAIDAVLADGRVEAAEVKYIEQLFRSLGFPAEDAYAALHRGAAGSDEPIAVRPAIPESGTSVPPSPGMAAEKATSIDRKKIERITKETAKVAGLLSEIFASEDEEFVQPPSKVADNMSLRFEGLDQQHGELLSFLLANGELSRPSFESEARRLQLLPDGAMETINEWGFDVIGEPVLDAEDNICIVSDLFEEIQTLEKR
ncbi:MAG: TerB N-terminal domain-containing protein [Parvularculaceae bacterium]